MGLEAIDQTLYESRFTSLNEIKCNSFKISEYAKKKKSVLDPGCMNELCDAAPVQWFTNTVLLLSRERKTLP